MMPTAANGGGGAEAPAGAARSEDVRPAGRRGSFLALVFVGPFKPRLAAADPASPYWRSFVVHVAGLLVLGAVCVAGIGLEAAASRSYAGGLARNHEPGWNGAGVPARLVIVVFGACLLGGCAAAPVLGICLSCWAWRMEPLADTLRYALRTVARVTPALTLPVVCGWLTAVFAAMLDNSRWSTDRDLVLYLFLPVLLASYSCAAWVVVIYLKALGAERGARGPESQSPLCETCGYALVHLEGRPRCPECGTPVALSLSSEARTESPLEWGPPRLSSQKTWERIAQAWSTPDLFLRRLRMEGLLPWAWGILCRNLALCWLLLPPLVVLLIAMGQGVANWREFRDILVICYAMVGIPLTGVLIGWNAVVSILGLLASRKYGRNVMGPTTLVAAMLSSGLVAWVLGAVFAQVMIFIIADTAGSFGALPYLEVLWGTANLLVLTCLAIAVWRRLRWVGYGNWHISTADPPDRSGPGLRSGCAMADVGR